ncbi:hypothetical protein G7K_6248-t1 [Saitoella complicata NRRL Y-17804]|uniref:dihydroorotase n=2 Tax=Saitoella complicata (strain BCRC 22490 / CBS 7301 / JCM 7358 / NBRC 10748 / NRRL Y-17804) TaxID=698492 RepID=A0A0E9NQN8_SAICN|nr:hypothetical protein G7K_6248-t1 [Saitoella complicata NRRL Y-17804]
MATSITILPAADFHVHLRQDALMRLVTPTVRQGGASIAYVMPNLTPPITTTEMAMNYKKELQAIEPNVEFMMTLYLTADLTVEEVKKAAAAGVSGVKVYPAGVTTNSSAGVSTYEPFYPIFAAMEEVNMVLNLHGEVPPSPTNSVLTAEHDFLPTLIDLAKRFPKLRIVLEHCTTKDAIETVKNCGPNVAGSITAHHLHITIDSWADNPFCYCKPVAKTPEDRAALIEAAVSGDPRFFLGSDSAPHPREKKSGAARIAAGVFTQSRLLSYAAEIFDKQGKMDKFEDFVSNFGRKFYQVEGLGVGTEKVKLTKKPIKVESEVWDGELVVVPFMATEELQWDIEWVKA